jgi:transposase-like protein
MATIEVKCPRCGDTKVIRHGISESGKQRYFCKNTSCPAKSFQLEHAYIGCQPGINEKIVTMASNASGIRDTSRVLNVSQGKVISTLKKRKIK